VAGRRLDRERPEGTTAMFSVISGVVLIAIGGSGFWYFLPRNGQVHPMAKKPFLDSMITITIMTIVVLGIGLIVQAILS
jgi:hypothetical protein